MRYLVEKKVRATSNLQIKSISQHLTTFNPKQGQTLILKYLYFDQEFKHSLFISLRALDQSDLK